MANAKKRILVIDGNSIINRAYYGVRPLSTKAGKPTNAVFGMISIISKQLDAVKPDYAAVAFDLKIPTFRHKAYDGYKQGRHPTPDDLLAQFDDAKEVLTLMGIHVLSLPGYEADDIQGTVARFAKKLPNSESFVLSGDRDLLQLIDDDTTVLLATNAATVPMHEAEFREKYGVAPSQFIDMKALMGDSSDNIPGVKGIGEKTAQTLIQTFGSLEGIYENVEDPRITKSVREKLIADRAGADLSKFLATIVTDAPLDVTVEDLKYDGFDKPGLARKLNELELNSFIVKFGLKPEKMQPTVSIQASSDAYEKADETAARTFAGKTVAMAKAEGGFLLSDGERTLSLCDKAVLEALFRAPLKVVCHDGKSLFHALEKYGVTPADTTTFLDISLYAYLLNPGSGATTVATLSEQFLGKEDTGNPALLFPLEAALREKVREAGEEKLLDEAELPLIPVLARMETRGLLIDTAGMREFGEALDGLASELSERIYLQAGEVFNINSPKQLGEVLFVKMGLAAKAKKTKTGYSTDAETLEELRGVSPIVEDVLEYRQVTKLRSTYATALVEAADAEGRLHTDFKQALTATGRLSSADPNLQNIPIRTKMGRQMRKYCIAKPGYSLVDADYSQIELRLLAHISEDYHMIESFKEGADIHRTTAAAVFGLPEEEVTEELRKRAKAVNFGIVYGISGFSLSKDIGTSVAEANRYIKNYMMNYPSIEVYLEKVVKDAERDGYCTTFMGRRRYIPELAAQNRNVKNFGQRVAMNAPIQGAAADVIKLAMIRVDRRLREENLDAALVMQVHDELIVEARDELVERVKEILRDEMEGALTLSVPLTVDVTSGKNWLDQD